MQKQNINKCIKFTQTNKSPRSQFCGVRVYNQDSDRVVEYYLDQRSPLDYLRKRNGKHRKVFIELCLDAGVSQSEIDGLFADSHPNHGV